MNVLIIYNESPENLCIYDVEIYDEAIIGLLKKAHNNYAHLTVEDTELEEFILSIPERWNEDKIFDASETNSVTDYRTKVYNLIIVTGQDLR